MRIHNWFRTIAGTLALAAAADSAPAQDFGPGGPMAAPYGPTNDPAVLYPQGVPQGFNPWPQISPYGKGNMDQDQYVHRQGLWFEEILNKERNYYFGVDAIWGDVTATNGTLISSQTYPIDQLRLGAARYDFESYGEGLPVEGYPIGRGAFPFVVMRPGTQTAYIFQDNSFIFPLHDTGLLSGETNAGLEARWGFDDADGMGLMLSGFYLAPKTQTFQRGTDVINGVPVTPDMVTRSGGQILYTKNGAIAYDNGIEPGGDTPIGTVGATQKYDIMYRMTNTVDVAGGNLAFYMSPFLKTRSVLVRPFLAGRYMYINEQFNFTGVDSGFNYDVDQFDYGTQEPDFPDDPSTFRPDGRLVQRYEQFTATMENTVQSHIAGPEIGIRYDLGKRDGFQIWGATTVGLMANFADMNLRGNNIGEVLVTSELFGFDMLAADARFADSQTVGRVSPLFEQTIAVESRLFEAVPFLNEIPVLNQALFKFGYTFTAIGKVARATDTIDIKGFPLFPSLNANTQTFVMNRFNLGLEWTY